MQEWDETVRMASDTQVDDAEAIIIDDEMFIKGIYTVLMILHFFDDVILRNSNFAAVLFTVIV